MNPGRLIPRKLGRLPSPPDRRNLLLARYLDTSRLPDCPQNVSYSPAVLKNGGYGMLLNDTLGCCVVAAMMHTAMQQSANDGRVLPMPSADEVIAAYSAIGGYVPGDASTDKGCTMLDALKYWRNTGILIGGEVRKIGAFVAVSAKQETELASALWLFGSLFSAFRLPLAAQDLTAWTGVPANTEGDWAPGTWGGHAVCQADVVRKSPLDLYQTVTWGQLMPTDLGFMQVYCDEAYVVLSDDWLGDDEKCPAGFDKDALLKDLAAIGAPT